MRFTRSAVACTKNDALMKLAHRAGIAGVVLGVIALAQMSPAGAASGQTMQIETVPPGGVVTLTVPPADPAGLGPSEPSVVEVENRSEWPATVTYDGNVLTISVPAGFAIQVTPWAPGATCTEVDGRAYLVECKVDGRPPVRVSFTTIAQGSEAGALPPAAPLPAQSPPPAPAQPEAPPPGAPPPAEAPPTEIIAPAPVQPFATDEEALAFAAALRVFDGVPLVDCTTNNPRWRTCINPQSTVPVTAERGTAAFGLSDPEGLGGALAVMGRGSFGDWDYWFATQNITYRRFELPGAMIVCADGDGANLRAAPGLDAEILGVLADLTTVQAEGFVLTQPGTVSPLTAGAGWYRLSVPYAGWVYSEILSDARLGDCSFRDASVRAGT